METETRACVNLEKFIDYIQKNYRSSLVPVDYEIITEIADNYPREEIIKAMNYCKSKKSNSLMYLKDALSKKYYEDLDNSIVPDWMNKDLKAEPLSDEEKQEMEELLKEFK